MVLEERMDDQNKSGLGNAKGTWPSWVGLVSLGREGTPEEEGLRRKTIGPHPQHSTAVALQWGSRFRRVGFGLWCKQR